MIAADKHVREGKRAEACLISAHVGGADVIKQIAGNHQRIAALRGAAYEDPDWGNEIISVMDNATRNEFRATVRRWQETRRLLEHQKQAFEAYSAMYGTYEVKRPK